MSNLARIETDCELILSAPKIESVQEADIEKYSSRSVAVMDYAKRLHQDKIKRLNAPWWQNLGLGAGGSDSEEEENDLLKDLPGGNHHAKSDYDEKYKLPSPPTDDEQIL